MNNQSSGQSQGGFLSKRRPNLGSKALMGSVSMCLKGFQMYNQYRALREHERNLAKIDSGEISRLQEDTYLKTFGDAVEAGFINLENNYGRGMYCGELKDHTGKACNFQIMSDSHALILGRAGSFKTKSIVEQMAYRFAQAGQSIILPDIKGGELADEVIWGLEKIYGEKLSVFDPTIPLCSGVMINPLSDLIEAVKTGKPITDLAKSKAVLFRGDPGTGNNSWIGKATIRLTWMFTQFLALESPELCTPGMLADVATLPHDDFIKLLGELSKSEASDGFVAAMANKFRHEYAEPSEQFEWVMADSVETFSAYLKGGALRECTNDTNIDLPRLKNKPSALILKDPEQLVFGHPGYYRVRTEHLINTLAYAKGNVHCNFLWDEFANYPAVEAVIRGERLYRSKKIRFILIAQDDKSFKQYDKWGGYEALAENSVQLILSCDGKVAELISKKAGKHAVSIRQGGSNFGSNMTANQGAQEILVENLPVSVIAQGLKGKVIVDTRTDGIYILDRPPIWEIDDLQQYRSKDITE